MTELELLKALRKLEQNIRADAQNNGSDIRHPRVVLENRANDIAAICDMAEAALPHLTDDGAGSGEPAVAAGEAGSIPAGNPAPSSPHPCGHEPLVGLYDDTRTLTIQGSINHEVSIKLGDEETFFTWADSFLATAHCAAYEAGEGATPAIDREALIRTLHDEGAYCGNCDYEDWIACEDCRKVLGHYADAVLKLIAGAS